MGKDQVFLLFYGYMFFFVMETVGCSIWHLMYMLTAALENQSSSKFHFVPFLQLDITKSSYS